MLPLSGREAGDVESGSEPLLAVSRPEGLESVLSMAAADEAFARALVADRERTLRTSGVELAPTERAVLLSVGARELARMIGNLDGAIVDPERRAALTRLAALAVGALGGALTQGACSQEPSLGRDAPALGGPVQANPLPGAPVAEKTSPEGPVGGADLKLGKVRWGSWRELGHSSTGARPDRVPVRRKKPRSRVTMGTVTKKGPMDAAVARRIIRRRLNTLRYCYEAFGLHYNSKLKGTITASFTVSAKGRLSKVVLKSNLKAKKVERCVRRFMRVWRFPAKKSTTLISVPFHFAPK